MTDQPLRYSFNLPWAAAVFGALLYAGLTLLMIHWARDFSGLLAAVLYCLSAMFAGLAVFMIARRLLYPRVLELGEEAILFPRGFPRTKITRIPYADIIRTGKSRGFYLATFNGTSDIDSAYLPDMESYLAVRSLIFSKVSIPKTILRWLEPADWPRYRTHLVASKPLLHRLHIRAWFFIRCFGIILVPWLLLQLVQIPTASTGDFLVISISGTLFFTLIHWLYARYPVDSREVTFHDKGISYTEGRQIFDRDYRYFSGWAVAERQFEGRVLQILLLQGRFQVSEFALPDTSTLERLIQLFHEKQLPHLPNLKPSWEKQP